MSGVNSGLSAITTQGRKLPSRCVLHAIPKFGKTSFAACAPAPVFLMTRGEDGLLSLMEAGLVGPTSHFPEPFSGWNPLMNAVASLSRGGHGYRTLVIDTINGAERLAHEATCAADCGGDWSSFDGFGRGVKLSLARLITLTTTLDRCREAGMGVILLAHSQVKTFKNPQGPDYDRWEPTLTQQTWAHLDRWADMILFGQFEVATVQKDRRLSKAKVTGSQSRVIMTERSPAYDAGNRLGLPPAIDCGDCAADAWGNFVSAIRRRPTAQPQQPAAQPEDAARVDWVPDAPAERPAPPSGVNPDRRVEVSAPPKKPRPLGQVLTDLDAALVSRGLCAEGALEAELLSELAQRHGNDVAGWPEAEALDAAKHFAAAAKEGQVDRLLAAKAADWGAVCRACGFPETHPTKLTLEQYDAAAGHLAAMPSPADLIEEGADAPQSPRRAAAKPRPKKAATSKG